MFDDLIEHLGEAAAYQLIAHLGGCEITIPHYRESPVAGSWLARIVAAIGDEAAQKLCAVYLHEIIAIPIGRELRSAEIRAKVLLGRQTGHTTNAIALSCHITRRRVLQILQQHAITSHEQQRQGTLF